MPDKLVEFELKFDGPPVRSLKGAPAESVIASLNAIQRMVHIIGMRAEGRALSERLKPTAKVRREYVVVCRASVEGSHIQPFAIASQSGAATGAAVVARSKLLNALRAFDSGKPDVLEEVIPSARERWFMAKAATGLLPAEESGLRIAIRLGSRGRFAFKADNARTLLQAYDTPHPPGIDEEKVAGKLRAIDYAQTIMTIKPRDKPALRMDYPLKLENWLQLNVRKRLLFAGRPKISSRGDITSFSEIYAVSEVEPHLAPIDGFSSGGRTIKATRQLSLPITVFWTDRLFSFRDSELGIDVVVQDMDDLRSMVLSELDILWRHYALAHADELDEEAQQVRRALLARFEFVD